MDIAVAAAVIAAIASLMTAMTLYFRRAPEVVRSGSGWRIYNVSKGHPVVIRQIINQTGEPISFGPTNAISDLFPGKEDLVYWDIAPDSSMDVNFFNVAGSPFLDNYEGPIPGPPKEGRYTLKIKRLGIWGPNFFQAVNFDLEVVICNNHR